ncbi:MobA/MobL family protein [Leisingera daeponensis]|uniref:MobA/MobL family protein n=1 Tax=Leisingera daeponensis TaxID=405746 RepID=UPI000484EAE1|nr:MobA/MobL family protein [Leisingera daeponensis]
MALFSFKHSVRTFSEKRTADARQAEHGQTAAHLRYITRQQAARCVLRERLAGKTDAETGTLAEQEAERRKGRVCERFILALPVEATPDQRAALVKEFCETFTQGVAGYVAAIHDQTGNDIANPHAHVVAFDVQVKTGGRGRPRSTLGMARKNAVETTAAQWASIHNRMMDAWGYGQDSHITHLSFAARGIDRIPQIHEGAASRKMAGHGDKIAPKAEWHHIDQGHSRADANAVIREINSMKEMQNEQTEHGNRLGRPHDDDRAQRRDRRQDVGTHGVSRGSGVGSPTPPFASAEPVGEDLRGDQNTASADAPAVFPPFFVRSAAAENAPSPFDRRILRGSRIRWVYRELVMLRDTLRARLFRRDPENDPTPMTAAQIESMRPRSRIQQHYR